MSSDNGAEADDGESPVATDTPDAGDGDETDTSESGDGNTSDADDGDAPDGDELLGVALDARERIDTIQGTMTTRTTSGEQSVTVTQEIWLRPPDEQRMETVETNAPEAGPTVTVTNGTVRWLYFEAETRAVRVDPGTSIPSLDRPRLATELQVDPSNVDTTRNGTATIAGRDVHVVEFTASTEEATYESGTLWIDAETNYPLKQEATLSAGSEELTFSYEFEDVTFGEPINDDVFAFDPPADTEVRAFADLRSDRYDSIDDAEAAVPFDLPDPDVPDGYSFQTAVAGENLRGHSASVQYSNENGTTITVTVSESATSTSSLVDSESVKIDGVDARITTTRNNVGIEWTDDDLDYTVVGIKIGEDLSEETLIEFVESIVE